MPFIYELQLQEDEPDYTLTQHLVPEGTLVTAGQPIAMLSDGSVDYQLPATIEGLLVAWIAQPGDSVNIAEPFARIVCEAAELEVPDAVPQRIG